MGSSSSLDVPLVDVLALERAAFAYHDGDTNPFDHFPPHVRLRVLTTVRWRRAYELYLRSDAWQAKRAAVLERAGRSCERCPAGSGLFPVALDVHHLTYAHLGDELLDELEALCRPCHERADRERRRNRRRLR